MVTSVAVYTLPTEIQNALNAKKFVGVEYDYDKKEVRVNMTAVRSFFTPDWFTVPEGWKVKITLVNVEQALDITHGLALEGHNILVAIDPGQVREIELTADKTGVFWYYCIWFCSELHLEMRGRMIVIPENEWSPDLEWKP
jgi:nitrous-oxide reductase